MSASTLERLNYDEYIASFPDYRILNVRFHIGAAQLRLTEVFLDKVKGNAHVRFHIGAAQLRQDILMLWS